MDYEKKNNEALEKARKRVATEPQDHTDAILKDIFPELCESEDEDERIRESLLAYIKGESKRLDTQKWIAYLEKQKEQDWNKKPCLTCQEYEKGHKQGYTEGCTAGYNKAMKEVEQKEQKQEWSEEDEGMIKRVIERIEAEIQYGDALTMVYGNQEIAWLKSLRPQKLDASKLENFDPVDVLNRIKTEWPMAWEKVVGKQVWSEEDKKMMDEVLDRITYAFYEQGNEGEIEDDPVFLWVHKLRPSWKPSEEQMEALRRAVNKLAKTDVADSVRLSIMYDNLNKL